MTGGDPEAVGGADTAGRSWQGRQVPGTEFDRDDGTADAQVRQALADGEEGALMQVLRTARLLVPIVAAPQEQGPALSPAESSDAVAGGVRAATEMAVLTLTAPDGGRALPVFSGVDALAAWNPRARPIPVSADRAAQAAIAEDCDVLVLDLAGPHSRALRSSMVWALARSQDWVPAYADPLVQEAMAQAGRGEPDLLEVHLEDGTDAGPGVTRAVLFVRPGLAAEQVSALATRLAESLAAMVSVRSRIDGLVFTVRPARDGRDTPVGVS